MIPIDTLSGDTTIDRTIDAMDDLTTALRNAMDKLRVFEAAMNHLATGDVDEGDVPDGSYGYIPLDLGDFFDTLFSLEKALRADPDYADSDLRHRRVDLLDIGCGPGRNVFLAGLTDRFEFRNVTGFDISKPLIERGRQIFGLGDRITVGDCMDHDYSTVDVAYFYRPFHDDTAQKAFEDYLVSTMPTGAYVIGCLNLTFDEDRRMIGKDEDGRIFKKLK